MSCYLIKSLCLAEPDERSSSEEDREDDDEDDIKILLDQLFDIKYAQHDEQQAQQQQREPRSFIPDVFTWHFDPVNMIITSQTLRDMFFKVIEESNLATSLAISCEKLGVFAEQVSNMYQKSKNPYHNILHAIHVFHSMHMFLKLNTAIQKFPMLLFASYIAAFCHDLDHCGSTNRFLVATKNKKAIKYNGLNPQEMHHAFVTLQLVDESNFVEGSRLAKNELVFKDHIVKIIMSSNIAVHNTFIEQFDATNPLACVQLLLKCADLSHTFSILEYHLKWVNLLQSEFFIQGDRERVLGLVVNPIFDRNVRSKLHAIQSQFFSIIVIPMFEVLFRTFPMAAKTPIEENIKINSKHWSKRAALIPKNS